MRDFILISFIFKFALLSDSLITVNEFTMTLKISTANTFFVIFVFIITGIFKLFCHSDHKQTNKQARAGDHGSATSEDRS